MQWIQSIQQMFILLPKETTGQHHVQYTKQLIPLSPGIQPYYSKGNQSHKLSSISSSRSSSTPLYPPYPPPNSSCPFPFPLAGARLE